MTYEKRKQTCNLIILLFLHYNGKLIKFLIIKLIFCNIKNINKILNIIQLLSSAKCTLYEIYTNSCLYYKHKFNKMYLNL